MILRVKRQAMYIMNVGLGRMEMDRNSLAERKRQERIANHTCCYKLIWVTYGDNYFVCVGSVLSCCCLVGFCEYCFWGLMEPAVDSDPAAPKSEIKMPAITNAMKK